MKTLAVDLPDDLAHELSAQAEARGTTESAILRQVVGDYIARTPPPREGSFLELAGDLIGCVEGPGDLSFNKKHLDDYGR